MGGVEDSLKDISVIIPAYNAENTLQRAIDSVVNQSSGTFEIIIINDGSSDSTLEVAEEYALRDNRLRIVSQQNAGSGATRNNGIDLANGRVVAFLDSDDEFVPDCFSRVLDLIDRNTDIDVIASDLVVIDESGAQNPSSELLLKRFPSGIIVRGYEAKKLFCERRLSPYSPTYFYKKSFLKRNGLRFPEPGRLLEDLVFVSDVLSKNPILACLQGGPTYRYYMRNDSMAHGRDIGKAKQAIESIDLAERNVLGVVQSDKFIIEQLLFAYYLASDDDTDEGTLVRKKIVDKIRMRPLTAVLGLHFKDIVKTALILMNARTIIKMMYGR